MADGKITVLGSKVIGCLAVAGLAGAAYIMTSDPQTSILSPDRRDQVQQPASAQRPAVCGATGCAQATLRR